MIDLTGTNAVPPEKTAVAMGLFDGLHIGHQDVINKTREFSMTGLAPAIFTFETDTVTSKGDGGVEVLLSRELKYDFLDKLGVRYIFSPDFEQIRHITGEEFVRKILKEKLNAGAVICGDNFTFGRGGTCGIEQLQELCPLYGIEVIVIPPAKVNGEMVSSTKIRQYLREGDIRSANRMLGYSFQLKLPVIRGNALGRTMNFPTINQSLPERQLVPRFGVYASKTQVDGQQYDSITNVGLKPTVGGEKTPLAETFIMDYSGDLYGQEIVVSLTGFLRPEKKFDTLDELFAQIAADIETAKDFIRKGK